MKNIHSLLSTPATSYEDAKIAIKSNPSKINSFDARGRYPLHKAARIGRTDIANLLIVWGANPNVRDNRGFTPLHLAVWAGHDQTVKLLLENNALADTTEDFGRTPLHLLALSPHQDAALTIAEQLLVYGSYPKKKDQFGFTPIDYLKITQRNELMKFITSF